MINARYTHTHIYIYIYMQWHTIAKAQNNPDEYCVQKMENGKTALVMSPKKLMK